MYGGNPNFHKILAENLKGSDHIREPNSTPEDNIKTDLKQVVKV
jgi:hypothetical protein